MTKTCIFIFSLHSHTSNKLKDPYEKIAFNLEQWVTKTRIFIFNPMSAIRSHKNMRFYPHKKHQDMENYIY